jgi:hypothetical protein
MDSTWTHGLLLGLGQLAKLYREASPPSSNDQRDKVSILFFVSFLLSRAGLVYIILFLPSSRSSPRSPNFVPPSSSPSQPIRTLPPLAPLSPTPPPSHVSLLPNFPPRNLFPPPPPQTRPKSPPPLPRPTKISSPSLSKPAHPTSKRPSPPPMPPSASSLTSRKTSRICSPSSRRSIPCCSRRSPRCWGMSASRRRRGVRGL